MNVLPNCPSRKAVIITLLHNISQTEMMLFFTRNICSLQLLALICSEVAYSGCRNKKDALLTLVSEWPEIGSLLDVIDLPEQQRRQSTLFDLAVGNADMLWKCSNINYPMRYFPLEESEWNEMSISRRYVALTLSRSTRELRSSPKAKSLLPVRLSGQCRVLTEPGEILEIHHHSGSFTRLWAPPV